MFLDIHLNEVSQDISLDESMQQPKKTSNIHNKQLKVEHFVFYMH